MDWFLNFSDWCAGQRPFWAAVEMFLCLALAVSATVLMVLRSELSFRFNAQSYSFFIAYLIFKALLYLQLYLPFDSFAGPRLASLFPIITQSIGNLFLLAFAISLLSQAGDKLKKGLWPAVLVLLAAECAAIFFLSQTQGRAWPAMIEGVISIMAVGCLFIQGERTKEGVHRGLVVIGAVWLCYALSDYVGWGEFLSKADPVGRFLGWVGASIFLFACVIGCNSQIGGNTTALRGKGAWLGRKIILECAVLLGAVAIACILTNNLCRDFYDSLVRDAEADTEIVREHVLALKKLDESFVRACAGSPAVTQFWAADGAHSQNQIDEIINRYAQSIGGVVCYALDASGKVVSSSNQNTVENIVGKNYAYRKYFKEAVNGNIGGLYAHQAINGSPSMYTSCPVHEPQTGAIIGVVALQRTISAKMLFTGFTESILFDEDGSILLASRPYGHYLKKQDFLKEERLWPPHELASENGVMMIKINDGIYILSGLMLEGDNASIAVLNTAQPFIVYSATVYLIMDLVLLFISSGFVFFRFAAMQTDRELRQSRELKEILDCSPNCIAILNPGMACLQVYGAGVPSLGHSESEMANRPFLDLWPVGQRIMIRDRIRNVLAGDNTSFESSYVHPDGHTKYFFIFCGPLFDSMGAVNRVVTVWVDITHRKKIEQELVGRLELERTLSGITQEFLSGEVMEEAIQKSLRHIFEYSKSDRVSWFEVSREGGAAQCLFKHDGEHLSIDSMIGFVPKLAFEGQAAAWLTFMQDERVMLFVRENPDPLVGRFLEDQKLKMVLVVPILLERKLKGFLRLDSVRDRAPWTAGEISRFKIIAAHLQENIQRARNQQNMMLLDAAVHAAEDAIIITEQITSPTPRVVFANPAVSHMTGYSPEELIGKSPFLLYADNPNLPEEVTDSLLGNKQFQRQMINRRKDGSEFLAEVTVSPIVNARGDITHAVSVRRDITERAKSREKLKMLSAAVSSAGEGVMILSVPLPGEMPRIVFVNPAFCQQNGYSEEELLGATPELFHVPTAESGDVLNVVSGFIAGKSYRREVLHQRKDKRQILVESTFSPILNAEGQPVHYMCIERDITQEREMQNRSSLSSKLESIGQLAAGIAHEINTPAQFISDNLFFLKESFSKISAAVPPDTFPVPEPQKTKLVKLANEIPAAIADGIEGVQRISTIVQAMREFSHTSGEKNRADLNKAIATTITVARNEWKYDAELKTEFDPNLPQIVCHVGDINQVILNLIVNSSHAIKEKFKSRSGEKQGLITIRTQSVPEGVKIEVEDNGSGIPEKIRAKVFDPFFTTKPQGQGTGQGLYLAHRVIVEKHKGTISFTSTPGVGTKFTIMLPLE